MWVGYTSDMSEYDPSQLKALGRTHREVRETLARIRPALANEIRAAHNAGIPQVEIVKLTGYTRDQIRQICLPADRRRSRR